MQEQEEWNAEAAAEFSERMEREARRYPQNLSLEEDG